MPHATRPGEGADDMKPKLRSFDSTLHIYNKGQQGERYSEQA